MHGSERDFIACAGAWWYGECKFKECQVNYFKVRVQRPVTSQTSTVGGSGVYMSSTLLGSGCAQLLRIFARTMNREVFRKPWDALELRGWYRMECSANIDLLWWVSDCQTN